MTTKILKLPVLALVMAVFLSPTLYAQPLEQRVERLERIADNPILLQHSQRIEQQQREIQGLYDQIDHMQRQLSELGKKLTDLTHNNSSRLERLENQVDELSLSSGNVNLVPVDTRLNESVEVVIADNQEADLDTHPSLLEDDKVVAAEVKPQETTPPLVAETAQLSSQDSYNQAFRLLRENNFDTSILAFNQFVENFPQDRLTSNAYYWLGEAYMIKQDFELAFRAFNQVITDFSQTDKYPDALLRAADSLVGLNRLEEAQSIYKHLINEIPNSRSAKTAERRLERFN
jgi:tol-pal system protein YbgF